MKLEMFEHTVTYRDLVGKLNAMKAIADEHSIPYDKMLEVQGLKV
jgi:hypothetical protein